MANQNPELRIKEVAHPPQKVRIIGGVWRGINIAVAPVAAVRPTPNRVREMLFNWLQGDIEGAECLDLFAGSGALGIEAVSRGARYSLLVEADRSVCELLQKQLIKLKTDQVDVLLADAYQFIDKPQQSFDLVFLDPPFAYDNLDQTISQVIEAGVVKSNGLIYVETAVTQAQLVIPTGWDWYKHKTVSDVHCGILHKIAV